MGLHHPAPCGCVAPGRGEMGQEIERGSPGSPGGVEIVCMTSLLPEGSGGRGQDCTIPAVSICPLGHNLFIPKWTPPVGRRTCTFRAP